MSNHIDFRYRINKLELFILIMKGSMENGSVGEQPKTNGIQPGKNCKRATPQAQKSLATTLTNQTQASIKKLSSPYGIGYKGFLEIRKEVKNINPKEAIEIPLIRQTYENIVKEYLRIIENDPKIIKNDPETLREVMHYSCMYHENEIAKDTLCKKVRVYLKKAYKKLDEKDKTLKNKYEFLLEETAALVTD